MIRVFQRRDGHWQLDSWDKPELPSRNVWIDLVSPSTEEVSQVQKHFSIEIPSRAEMQEIEATSRLYQENGAYFMTANAVTSPVHDSMESSAITFILSTAFLISTPISPAWACRCRCSDAATAARSIFRAATRWGSSSTPERL